MIDIGTLQNKFHIDPSGELRRKHLLNNGKDRDIPGSINKFSGYRYIKIGNKSYSFSRIAFAVQHGYFPEEVDHIDGNPLNNNILNLRPCTHKQNSRNRKIHKNKKLPFKGVYQARECKNTWYAAITISGIYYYLGSFNTIEEAAVAYDMKAKELCGEFARTNFN